MYLIPCLIASAEKRSPGLTDVSETMRSSSGNRPPWSSWIVIRVMESPENCDAGAGPAYASSMQTTARMQNNFMTIFLAYQRMNVKDRNRKNARSGRFISENQRAANGGAFLRSEPRQL